MTIFHKCVKLKKEDTTMPALGTALKVAEKTTKAAKDYEKETEPEQTESKEVKETEPTVEKPTTEPTETDEGSAEQTEADMPSTSSEGETVKEVPNPNETKDTNDYKKMYEELKKQYETVFKNGATGQYDTLGNETKQEREQTDADRLKYGDLFADAEEAATNERARERGEAKEMATSGNYQQLRRPIENKEQAFLSEGEDLAGRTQGIKEQKEMESGINNKPIKSFDDLFDSISDSINIATTARNITR